MTGGLTKVTLILKDFQEEGVTIEVVEFERYH